MKESDERMVVETSRLYKYTIMYLDQEIPWKIRWNKYLIDGIVYDPVVAYDVASNVIVIEEEGDFVGKTVKFIL